MKKLYAKFKEWRENPVSFVKEQFNAEPDEWQKDALMLFAKNQRIAMKASKGVGKSTILAWCIWNFLLTRPHPKIAVTSVTGDNLSDGLWAELSKWQQRSPLLQELFEVTKTKIFAKQFPDTWFISARQWSKSASKEQQANSLAGLHADYILFVLDESGGIPDAVMAAAEGALASGIECKILQAGNPTHLEGPLYRACTKEAHLWKVIEISSDPDDPKRSTRVSIQWAKEQIEKYGKDDPWVLVNVYGKFPPASINSLIGPDEVRAAVTRGLKEDQFANSQKRLGIDCARFGDDRTVIFPRQGLRAFKPVEMRNARSNEIASRAMMAKYKWGSEMEFVDDTGGFGSGVIDSMIQAGASPVGIHFAGKATDPRYFNKRSEMWFEMCEWIKRGGSIPNIPELIAELTAPTYTFKSGKFYLEEKDQIKEKLGRSPDYADALALTFAFPEMPAKNPEIPILSDNNFKSDYDPFDTNRHWGENN